MGAKGFLNLSSKESLVSYKAILENSNRKWATAANNAEAGDYGSAINSAVISIEELVKALIVAMNGHGFEFRKVPAMQQFFKNHKIRYLLAYAMFLVNIFSQEIGLYILRIKSNPQDMIDWMHRLFANEIGALNNLDAYWRLKSRLVRREFEWFEKVDIFRQDAMYSDFDEGIKSPLFITPETYIDTVERLKKVRDVGLSLIETLESSDEVYVNHYRMMKNQFKVDNYYPKIEALLMGIKRTGVPFQSIRERFNKIDN